MNKLWNERRYGEFCLDHELIKNLPAEVLHNFFKCLIVVRAELEFASMQIRYIALSSVFEAVPEGYIPPRYEVGLKREYDDDSCSIVGLYFQVVEVTL